MRSNTKARTASASRVSVADAARLLLAELHSRAEADQVGWAYYNDCRYRLDRIVEVLTPELPLRKVDSAVLRNVVLHFAKRPPCRGRRFQPAAPGRPISVCTARGLILSAKMLFSWIAESDAFTWERPRGFGRIFRLKEQRLKTPAELARESSEVVSSEVRLLSSPDLSRLFRAGTARDRLFILLGLNCGFTSSEISSLHTFEVHLGGEQPFIHRRRPKTGVEARWSLWPETVHLLRRFQAAPNPGRLWLLTAQGNPLVEVTKEGRRDAVARAWDVLRGRCGLPRTLGHRFLRKTGASAIKRLGGLEESEMYLAHQEPGLNKHYANRNWEKLWRCLHQFRGTLPFLGPAWDLEPGECLFTQNGNPDWSEINPAWTQHVTKRSETQMLNVSLNKRKGLFYARVYAGGVTYSRGYFERAEDAAHAAERIRVLMDAGLDPREHLPLHMPGQRAADRHPSSGRRKRSVRTGRGLRVIVRPPPRPPLRHD